MPNTYFPHNPNEKAKNPAIQLFGNRLHIDQTVSDLLVEFLLVAFSTKKIGNKPEFSSAFPHSELWPELDHEKLKYAPKARLNLKLFSFLGVSRLDSRHHTHRIHHKELILELQDRINSGGNCDKDEVVRTIENLFIGFQGAGSGRTWCAQSFLPVSDSLLAGESIWNVTKAKKLKDEEWLDLFHTKSEYFSMNKHIFLARGGELLYLQICNALRQPIKVINNWCDKKDFGLSSEEQDPSWLHEQLEGAIMQFMKQCPDALSELARFIDTTLDSETPKKTDYSEEDQRFVTSGWCNVESWQEGYLFCVELLRILKSNLDIIDRISLLETACAMQVLRTLLTQSSRVVESQSKDWPDYKIAVSAPDEKRAIIKRLSQQSVKKVEKTIYQAIRNKNYVDLPQDQIDLDRILKNADNEYGSKLFRGLSKRIGLIVPKRGGGARFILNDQLLRLLVVTTVPYGGRLTFDSFKLYLEHRYGLIFGADGFDRASQWLTGRSAFLSTDTDDWLVNMLEAAGFLIHLSDSCALVHNPADTPIN